MIFFGRELENFILQGKLVAMYLHGSKPFCRDHPLFLSTDSLSTPAFANEIWISSPESLWAEISSSGTTGPSHKDYLAEIFLKGWLPMEKAFPTTVNTSTSCT